MTCQELRAGCRILRESRVGKVSQRALCSFYVLFVFLHPSYGGTGESMTTREIRCAMPDPAFPAGIPLDDGLARLLLSAVIASGRARQDIAQEARIHKDALRRILEGKRAATLDEAIRILSASGAKPHAALALQLLGKSGKATDWMDTDLGYFLEIFLQELPEALERSLGNQLHEVRPRWAKGAAHRVASLLAEHIDELERRDTLYAK